MEALEITHQDGRLHLAGELDLHTAPQLKEAMANAPTHDQVTLDLSELTFIDSSGLHAIIECARSQNGHGPLIVEGASPTTLRLFEIAQITQHPSVEIR